MSNISTHLYTYFCILTFVVLGRSIVGLGSYARVSFGGKLGLSSINFRFGFNLNVYELEN